jgi:hypothetical protein
MNGGSVGPAGGGPVGGMTGLTTPLERGGGSSEPIVSAAAVAVGSSAESLEKENKDK